jgi:hypothetical protein
MELVSAAALTWATVSGWQQARATWAMPSGWAAVSPTARA